jgi:hypothetical protein
MSTSDGLNASGYNLFRFFVEVNIIYIFAYSARSNMFMNFASDMLLLSISWIKLLVNLAKFPTIQKRDRPFTSTGFASMLKPNVFYGTNYKRWRQRCILWMTSMHCFYVVEPRDVGLHTPEEDNVFHDADVRFRAGLLSVLGDTIVDAYVPLQSGKEMWDALQARYGASDVGSELYVMEQFHDLSNGR